MYYFNSVTNEATSAHPHELLDRMEVNEQRKRLKRCSNEKMRKTLSPGPELPEDEVECEYKTFCALYKLYIHPVGYDPITIKNHMTAF